MGNWMGSRPFLERLIKRLIQASVDGATKGNQAGHVEQLRTASPREVDDSNAAELKLHARYSKPTAGAKR